MSTLRSLRVITAACVLAAVFALPLAAQAMPAADEPLRWSLLPSDSEGEPFEFTLDSGKSVSESVVVTNLGEDPLNFLLKPVDVLNDETGALAFARPNEIPTATGLWISAPADTVTLAPGASVELAFRIVVPDDAEPGDYLAGLAVLDLDDDTAGDAAPPAVTLGTGVLTYVTVSGVREPGVELGPVSSSYAASVNPFSPGTLTVEYDVSNTGNTRIDVQQTVAITGPLGIVLAEATPARVPDLLPDQAVRTTLEVPGIPPLLLTWAGVSVVSLEPGAEPVVDATTGEPADVEAAAPEEVVAPTDPAETPAPADTPAPTTSAVAPPPGTDGPIVAETVDNYAILYPEESSSAMTLTISWTLLIIALIVLIAIIFAARLASGTRARNYLIIDELLAERAAQSGGQRGGTA